MAPKLLRIGIDASRTTRTQRTGTENYALRLIRALLQLEAPHHFTLYFRDQPAPDLFPAQPNLTLKVIPFPRLWTHLRFALALWQDRPDVIFVPAHSLPILFPGRAVVTIHDLGYLFFPGAHTRRSRWYLRWSTRYSARRAKTVIADSGATKRDLVTHERISADKIIVVYPGVDLIQPATPDQIAAVRARYKLPDRYLLFLGTIQPRKNITRLVEAYRAWRAAHSNQTVGLVLAGRRGWLSDSLLLDMPGVTVTGYIADADVAALYSGAIALVFPSLYEGFGFPVIEAMHAGTPVLTANTSSLPELAGDAALLVDPLDVAAITAGIDRLVSDPKRRAELVAKGTVQAQRFTWESAARHTLEILEKAAH